MARAKSLAEASERAKPLSDVPQSQLGAKDVTESRRGQLIGQYQKQHSIIYNERNVPY